MDGMGKNFGNSIGFAKRYESFKESCDHEFMASEISKLRKSDTFVLDAQKLIEAKKNIKLGIEFQYGVDSCYRFKPWNKKEHLGTKTNPKPEPIMSKSKLYGEIEEIEDEVERTFRELKNFDELPYPPFDHHFTKQPANKETSLAKRIQRERQILSQFLPSSIFVRVYASRIDVMRAVIVGREGSPYHQGLFFFDIFFPANFPTEPPQISYHSNYGLDFNPNLPNKANMLEILVSLQQMVFTSGTKPCKYLVLFEKERSSRLNKRVFVQTCEAMLHMLGRPPIDFKVFVLGYFRTRAHNILLNYKAYSADLGDQAVKLLFFKLVKAFEANGTYCRHHYDQKEYDMAFEKDEVSEINYDQVDDGRNFPSFQSFSLN